MTILEQFEALKSLVYTQHTTFIYSYFSTQSLHKIILDDLDFDIKYTTEFIAGFWFGVFVFFFSHAWT